VSLIPLGCYVPVVFGLLCMAGLVLPLFLTLLVAFRSPTQPKVSNASLAFGAVVAPVNMVGAYLLPRTANRSRDFHRPIGQGEKDS
jgi:hypothetical protein